MGRIAQFAGAVLVFGALFSVAVRAQTQTGTVEGKAFDEQSAVVPGVTITLTGSRGPQATVSDSLGGYRFVGVTPGSYTLKAELVGFSSQEVASVLVGLARTTTVDFTLKIAGLSEHLEVRANASNVDAKSSATETILSADLLTLMPIYSSTSADLLNNAPGINDSSAYGAQGSYGNALLLDGVDTRDPEGGSPWTAFNQNLIQEVQIGGLGAAAEYGGFTGAIINTVTKSGGNAFSGLFSMRYTGHSLAGDNITTSVLSQNPSIGQSVITKKLTDYTVQFGGPLKTNKAFFFLNVQRYSATTDPVGPVANSTEISPRFNVKLTLKPSSSQTLTMSTQYDSFNVTGRVGAWPASQATDRQTVAEDAPEWVWNFQYQKTFGTKSLLEAKFTGYSGYFNLDPVDPSPYTHDAVTGEFSGGGGGQFYADRSRNQGQVSLTRYADAFGTHALKFGLEIERSHVRSQGQPFGPAGFYVLAYDSVPYYQVSYGYDVQGDNHRVSGYLQDSWNAGQLTLNIGLRLDRIRGHSPVLQEDVYKPANSWGPRVGVAYDLRGNGKSALRAFWGRFYEGAATGFYTAATPGLQDVTFTTIFPDGSLGIPEVVVPGLVNGISQDIKHPRTDEFNLSWETQLTDTVKLTATGIWRNTGNFVNNVIADAMFRPVQDTNALTGQPLTVYAWANLATSNDSFFIRNIDGFRYLGTDGTLIATADPKRSYRGVMLLLDSSLKKRLGYQVSYVLSKADGTVDNSGGGSWLSGIPWETPNTAVINTDGELTNSRRHEIKVFASYQVPRVDLMLGVRYFGYSGSRYTPYAQFPIAQLSLPSSALGQVFLEPRGTEKNDFFNQVDLRLEKAMMTGGHRFGVFADILNLFNSATITARQPRYPSTTISSATVLYQAPTALQGARQVTLGARWTF